MNEVIENDCEILTPDMFDSALRYLVKKKSEKYKFILKGGSSLKNALFELFFSVWKTEQIPTVWQDSQLVQLCKGSGPVAELSSKRFIHMKCEEAKVFAQIVIT